MRTLRLAEGEKMKGINYTALVPVLIKGIQEQQQVIDKQESRIADLEKQLSGMETLRAEVAALAQLMNREVAEEEASKTVDKK